MGFWDLMGLSTCGQGEFNDAWLEDADPFGGSTEDIFGTDYSQPTLHETVDFNNDAAANLWNSDPSNVEQISQSLYDLGYTDVSVSYGEQSSGNEFGYDFEVSASGHPSIADYYDGGASVTTYNSDGGVVSQFETSYDGPVTDGTYGTPGYADSGSEYDWSFLEEPLTQPQSGFDTLGAVQSVAEFGAGFIPFGSAVVEAVKGNYKAALTEVGIETAMIAAGILTGGLAYGPLKAARITTVIGRMGDLKKFDNVIDVDTWRKSGRIPGDGDDAVTWAENRKWLDDRIDRGDRFEIGTDINTLPSVQNGYIPGQPNGYFTARELDYLNSQGIKPIINYR